MVSRRLAALDYVRVTGGCMAPRVPAGSWVAVDRGRGPVTGDLILVRHEHRLCVGFLGAWGGARWLVTLRGGPPVELADPLAVVGVVAHVVEVC
jgi:hypothetical protein